MRILFVAMGFALCALAGPAIAEIRLTSIKCPVPAEAAFRIDGALGEMDGVASEYQWLAKNRPEWQVDSQAEMSRDGRKFDLLTITHAGQTATICFDITAFFGKGGILPNKT